MVREREREGERDREIDRERLTFGTYFWLPDFSVGDFGNT